MGWNINDPSRKNLAISADDIRTYCAEIGVDGLVMIHMRALMNKLSETLRLFATLFKLPKIVIITLLMANTVLCILMLYNVVYILIVCQIIMKYQYWIPIQCCIL